MRVELREIAGERLEKHPVTGRLGRVAVPGRLIAVAEVAPGAESLLPSLLRTGHLCVVAEAGAAPAPRPAAAVLPAPAAAPSAAPAFATAAPEVPAPHKARRPTRRGE